MSAGSRLITAAEDHPGDERRDEARSAERARGAVGECGAGGRDHLAPGAVDQVPPAGVDDDGADHEPADDPADDAVADLLEQQRARAAPFGDVRCDVRGGNGREQQRHADPVVEPALDVQSLANPPRDARLGDHRLAERGVGGRQDHRQDHRLGKRSADRRSARRRAPRRRSSAAGRSRAGAPAPRCRAAAFRSRSARRRRRARTPASPRPVSARSRCRSRCRPRRGPWAPPGARSRRTGSRA